MQTGQRKLEMFIIEETSDSINEMNASNRPGGGGDLKWVAGKLESCKGPSKNRSL